MAELVLRKVVKEFGSLRVIHGIDLDIRHGEFVVFAGPSGCGKSTLLRMIAGLEEISDGQVLIDGDVVNEMPAARRELAMVFQSYAIYPHMSVRKNLAFGLETLGATKAEIAEKVQEAADVLQVNELLDRKPGQQSGGQRQRVAIGWAIVREPRIFLFDEPLSNLDAELRMQMRVAINRLHQRLGSTMIFVTHDQVEAMTLADRIAVLRRGVVEQVCTPLEFYNRLVNIFVAGFSVLLEWISSKAGSWASMDTMRTSNSTAANSSARSFQAPLERAPRSRLALGRRNSPWSEKATAFCVERCRSPSSWAARPISTSRCHMTTASRSRSRARPRWTLANGSPCVRRRQVSQFRQ
jgi:ABC-type sugar transport system ATPase subunit